MTKSRCIITVLFLHSILTPARAISPGEKVDLLDQGLRTIEEDARQERHVLGSGLLMLAAAGGVAAVFASQSKNEGVKADGPVILGVLGGLFAAGGVLTLVFRRDYEKLPESFRKMPERTPAEVAAKASEGEKSLRILGDRARRERYWAGGAAGLGGLVFLTWYAANSGYLGGATLYFSGFCFFVGLTSVLVESTAELELAKYREAKGGGLSLGVAPIPGGAMAQMVWRF